jgi:hypothetical protein
MSTAATPAWSLGAPGWTLTGKLSTSRRPAWSTSSSRAGTAKAEKGAMRARPALAQAGWFAARRCSRSASATASSTLTFRRATSAARATTASAGRRGPVGGRAGAGGLPEPRDEDGDAALLRRARASAALNTARWRTGSSAGGARHTGRRLDVDPATFASVYNRPRTTLALTARYALARSWSVGFKLDNATDEDTPEVLGYTAAPRAFTVQLQGQWQ